MYAIVPKGHCTNAIESQNTSSSRNHVKVKSTAATGSDLLEVKVEGELYLGHFLEAHCKLGHQLVTGHQLVCSPDFDL